jgi:hypothetical protein
MSFVNAVPQALTAAAGELAGIGSALAAANAAALATASADPMPANSPAAADAVSAALVAVFSAHGLGYQSLGTELAELHEQIVQALRSGGASYAAAEAENARLVQDVLDAAEAPVQTLGHPLLGNSESG